MSRRYGRATAKARIASRIAAEDRLAGTRHKNRGTGPSWAAEVQHRAELAQLLVENDRQTALGV